MAEEHPFFEINSCSLNHHGEELCGDQVKVVRTAKHSIVVLSDGLGSGVKANILARLTSEIIVTMIRAGATTAEVMDTVMGTLPVCQTRKIAYAAFVLLEIIHADGTFRVINFDTPAPVFISKGRLKPLERYGREICGRTVHFSKGRLERGDFLGLMSDGVLYAGMGGMYDFGWGEAQIGRFLEETLRLHAWSGEDVARRVIRETNKCYGGKAGDDATFVAILPRRANSLMVFTGPPVDEARDEACTERLLAFPGRKVICGGTTGNIVGAQLGVMVDTEIDTGREDVPPIGHLPGIDLATEGILTLAATLRLLQECDGLAGRLPDDRNGAVLLARELLLADSIFLLVGEQVNPYYQNPLLPRSVSIRRSVLVQIVDILKAHGKELTIEWC